MRGFFARGEIEEGSLPALFQGIKIISVQPNAAKDTFFIPSEVAVEDQKKCKAQMAMDKGSWHIRL